MTKRPTMKQKAQGFLLAEPLEGGRRPPWVAKAAAAKPRARPKREEDALQRTVCDYLKAQPRILFWATPANTYVGPMTGAKLGYLAKQKCMGVKKGIPDLCLLFKNKYGALTFCFAELKIGSNKATEEQQSMMDAANAIGAYSAVVRSIEDLRKLLLLAGYAF